MNARGAGGVTSTPTITDVVLSAALSVEPASNGSARRSEPSVDMEFAGALTFSDDGILFVGDNHNGAIYAFEIPGEEPPGQTVPRSIRNIDAKIAELLGVRVGAVEINDLAVHPVSKEIYISITRIESFATQPAIVKISVDSDISLLDMSSLAFQKQLLTEFPSGDTQFQVRGIGGRGPSSRETWRRAPSRFGRSRSWTWSTTRVSCSSPVLPTTVSNRPFDGSPTRSTARRA